jgi:hypothetical protein
MHDEDFERQLPDDLRDIADGLRDALAGGQAQRRMRSGSGALAGSPARKSYTTRLWPRLAVGLFVVALAVGLASKGVPGAPGGLGGFNLAAVVVSSSSSGATSASNAVYCDDGTQNDCTCPNPPTGWPNLSSFWSKYAVFGLNASGTQTLNFDSGYWYGNIGIPAGATLVVQHADAFYNANGGTNPRAYVDLGTNAHYNVQGTPSPAPATVTGSSVNSTLTSDRNTLISDSNTFAAMTPTVTYSAGISNANSSPIVITGGPGINVIKVTGNITLTSPLVLKGTANSFFVINVSGNINLQGSSNGSSSVGQIVVGGTTPPANLVVNVIGAHSIYSDRNGEQIQGTLLGPQASGASEFAGSYGAVYIGGNFEFQSYPSIHGESCGCGH